jgi:hypothetical protein
VFSSQVGGSRDIVMRRFWKFENENLLDANAEQRKNVCPKFSASSDPW